MSQGVCPYCGKPHPSGSVFCPETGQRLAETAPPPPAAYASPGHAAPPAASPQPAPYAGRFQQAVPQPAYPQAAPQGAAYPQQGAAYPQQGAAYPQQAGAYPQAAAYQQAAAYPQAAAHPPASPPAGGYRQPIPAAYAPPGARAPGVRHAYPLAIRDGSFSTAVSLMMRTLPYALARFGILLGVSIATLFWWIVAWGGLAVLSARIHPYVGFGWFFAACAIYGYLWWLIVRYFLYLLKCGHIAVLTELMTKGRIDDGGQGMFAYGKSVVKSRFGEVTVLFLIDSLIKGVVRTFNRTLDFVAGLLPIPGLSSIVSFVNAVIYAATTYLDETIFSYGLAREETNPWASAKDGLIYYAQNSKEILKTGVYVVILDKVLTVAVWVVMLAPAIALSWVMPRSVLGGWFVFLFAVLLASNIRAAFIKPLFLIMVMAKFHVQVQNQPINQEWDERLSRLSTKFREIDEKMRGYRREPLPLPA